jgi:hypothetical protein
MTAGLVLAPYPTPNRLIHLRHNRRIKPHLQSAQFHQFERLQALRVNKALFP